MLENRRIAGKGGNWQTGVDVFHTWMENDVLPGQEVLEEFREDIL
jgi:hypothetical protein